MPLDSREIFVIIITVPVLIFIGRLFRAKSQPAPQSDRQKEEAGFSPELKRKIRNGVYADGNTVMLATFDSDVEASIVRGLLIDNDIFAEMRDAAMGNTRFGYAQAVGGVKVFVHERELGQARNLLAEHQQISSFSGSEWQTRTCERCGSDMLTYQKYHPLSALILFLGAPFLPMKSGRWLCLKCGHKWKE